MRKRRKAKNRRTERGTYPDREYGQALPSGRKYAIIFHSRKKGKHCRMPFRGAAVCSRGVADMGKINREDMLELTRRMTLKRNCFDRIAGAYLDEEGFVDGTFNKHFQKLSQKDQQTNLKYCKGNSFFRYKRAA